MINKNGNTRRIYINEVIRINYKCNWSCKFCNVLKTNNYGIKDIGYKEVIYKILLLTKKYSLKQIENLILSFSGGEPTLNSNLISFIKLAKTIGIGTVEIQTNGIILFKNFDYIRKLIDVGLDEIFLAQHSGNNIVNKNLGSFYDIELFKKWVSFIEENKIYNKISIYLNIVVTKINLFYICDYIKFLLKIGFVDIIPIKNHNNNILTNKISFGLVQPNGYAELNKNEVLLKFNEKELNEIDRIIKLCKQNSILPDFHFTSPPLCILDYPEYNLEYTRLKKLKDDEKRGTMNIVNLETYKWLWKEKQKFKECKKCKYNDYCLGFYKNWVKFVGKKYIKEKINKFLLGK